jgi:hypothetical protein
MKKMNKTYEAPVAKVIELQTSNLMWGGDSMQEGGGDN